MLGGWTIGLRPRFLACFLLLICAQGALFLVLYRQSTAVSAAVDSFRQMETYADETQRLAAAVVNLRLTVNVWIRTEGPSMLPTLRDRLDAVERLLRSTATAPVATRLPAVAQPLDDLYQAFRSYADGLTQLKAILDEQQGVRAGVDAAGAALLSELVALRRTAEARDERAVAGAVVDTMEGWLRILRVRQSVGAEDLVRFRVARRQAPRPTASDPEVQAGFERMLRLEEEVFAATLRASAVAERRSRLQGEMVERGGQLSLLVVSAETAAIGGTDAFEDAVLAARSGFREAFVWLPVTLLVLSGGIGWLLFGAVDRPLRQLGDLVDRVLGGDTSLDVPRPATRDSIGRILAILGRRVRQDR